MLEKTFVMKATLRLKREVLPLTVVSHQERFG